MPGCNWQMDVRAVNNHKYHSLTPGQDRSPGFWEVDVHVYDTLTQSERVFTVPVEDAPRVGDIISANLAWGYE